jgi:hypothetical protein
MVAGGDESDVLQQSQEIDYKALEKKIEEFHSPPRQESAKT